MPATKIKRDDRCLITLIDKDGKQIERKIIAKPIYKFATYLGLKKNLDRGDQIIIESEEL